MVIFGGISSAVILHSQNASTPSHQNVQPATQPEQVILAKSVNQSVYLNNAPTLNTEVPEPSPKPPSLQDIDHGVQLQVNASGDLIVDEDVKYLFEFYLSAVGEESLEQTLNRVHFALAEQLQPPALDQARSLLKRYIDYKIELLTKIDDKPILLENKNLMVDGFDHLPLLIKID